MRGHVRRKWERMPLLAAELSCVALVCILFASQASAATLTAWNLAGQPGNQVSTPATDPAESCCDGIPLTRGPGVVASAAGNAFAANSWDSAAAADPNLDTEYFQFGFDVQPGKTVFLDEYYAGMRSSATGPGTMGVYASVDGGLYSLVQSLSMVTANPGVDFVNAVVDLSGLPPVEDSLRIRLIEIGNSDANPPGTTGANGTFRVTAYFQGGVFDRDMQITGTCVPEPASVLLVGMAVAGLFVGRRFA